MGKDESRDWFEDDSLWSTWRFSMFPEERWQEATAEVDCALKLLGVGEGAHILDLCCGPGRHSLELARRGYAVTAVDRNKQFLADLREAADAEGLEIEVVREDMRRFVREEAFDAAINLFTSFGYFEDQEDDRRVARNLQQSLRPGGPLLMDLMGKEILARIFTPSECREGEDGSLQIQLREATRNWTWMRNRWIVVRDGERIEHPVEHRIYSAAELMDLLADAGFRDLECYGQLSGTPYDHKARRLVVVARRPEAGPRR
ncbi:MAG TPA: class I SAM-dependent methyltransferase [Armatimonadota bacterium]|nr:class I SAM-dependent methyltransferase [Armatimonadota bacterium]